MRPTRHNGIQVAKEMTLNPEYLSVEVRIPNEGRQAALSEKE
jgi:hypothetical protein